MSDIDGGYNKKRWYLLCGITGTVFVAAILVVIVVLVLRQSEPTSMLVATTSGVVRGYKERDLFAFYNIPYATTPTGADRFKAPLPAPRWESTFEAVGSRVICLQPVYEDMNQQENCLVAHVYVPDTEEMNLPVVVSIHGGAYMAGMGDLPPHDLMKNKNIIYVSFNYRLHALGFLCLGTEGAPGNAGLKDQVALLRWVQDNIANFGGNPNHVTITGCSAGGSSVDLLTISKTTKGLFHSVHAESGANVAAWSSHHDPVKAAFDYARTINYTGSNDVYEIEEFYKSIPVEELFGDLQTLGLSNYGGNLAFTPCVERDVGGERIIHDSPVNIIQSGDYEKVPVLYGYNNKEGIFCFGFYGLYSTQMNDRFSDFLPSDLQFADDAEKEEVAKQVKEFYFGNATVGLDTIEHYVDFFTDTMFAYPMVRSARMRALMGGDVIYLFEYGFGTKQELSGYDGVSVTGASHCQHTETILIDDIDNSDAKLYEMSDMLKEIFLSFVLSGKPQPKGTSWDAVDASGSPLMVLNSSLSLAGPALGARAQLWDSIYDAHYRHPQPPPTPPTRT